MSRELTPAQKRRQRQRQAVKAKRALHGIESVKEQRRRVENDRLRRQRNSDLLAITLGFRL